MVSTWNSGSATSYNVLQDMLHNSSSQSGITFIDFLPQCLSPGGFIDDAAYETLWSLVHRANVWLRENPQWEIKSCESVTFGGNATSDMTYYHFGNLETEYVRGLRLWIRHTESNREVGQQIGYVNLSPLVTKEGGIFTASVYESLDEVINRFNTIVRRQPIPGRIVTIETERMRIPHFNKMDHPDKSSWEERGSKISKMYLFILRIFFVFSEECYEEIGIKDFIPEITERGNICKSHKYELFSSIVNRASQWCSRQTDVRICNVQSVEIKIRNGTDINPQKMTTETPASWSISYARIVRVAYVKSQSNMMRDSDYITYLTCKTFVPVQLKGGICTPDKFETIDETKARITAWMKETGAQVVSAETVTRDRDGYMERKYGHEASTTELFTNASRKRIYHIRVYLNGVYPEPSPEKLPPVPEIPKESCTIL